MYSAIEHLARIACVSNWSQVPTAMLTTAFDISNDEKTHKFLVLAGFISDADRWSEFDVKWRARLAEDGLTYFHMHPFAHSIGIFDGWKEQEDRRRNLMGDLLLLIREHAYCKFGIVVQSHSAAVMFPDHPKYKHKMLQVAVSGIVASVESWRARNRYQNPARYVFEYGDPGKGVIRKTVDRILHREPAFEHKKDNLTENIVAFTPLQAADLFCFEVKKVFENDRTKLRPGARFRVPYEVLNKMNEDAIVFNDASASDFGPFLEIDRYFNKNPLG